MRDGMSYAIQWNVVDTEAPNKVINVFNMFLVGFWCKEGLEQPAPVHDLSDVAYLGKRGDAFFALSLSRACRKVFS